MAYDFKSKAILLLQKCNFSFLVYLIFKVIKRFREITSPESFNINKFKNVFIFLYIDFLAA